MDRGVTLMIVAAVVVDAVGRNLAEPDLSAEWIGMDASKECPAGDVECATSFRQLRSRTASSTQVSAFSADQLQSVETAFGLQGSAASCSASYTDNCMYNPVCCTAGHVCHSKDSKLSLCMEKCVPGVHADDPPKYQTPWSCAVVTQAVHKTSFLGPLGQPSSGQLLTFHVYFAKEGGNQALENVNAANLPGVMWYLQSTMLSGSSTSIVSSILRLKVQMRATQLLLDRGMGFSSRVTFESGKCARPHCQYSWDNFGYTVGCNNLGEYPSPRSDTHYSDGILYSLPGAGRCQPFTPTGEGDCTWKYETAGEIDLADLYEAAGKSEKAFWATPDDNTANEGRVKAARDLFESRFGKDPAVPPCDFNLAKFYSDSAK